MKTFLFQNLKILNQAGEYLSLGSPKSNSILGYLLFNRNVQIDRGRLAYLFWPDSTEAAARRNLRQYLFRIRQELKSVNGNTDLFCANENFVQINPELDIWVDVEGFLQNTNQDATLTELRTAASVYKDDLLTNIYDDWCIRERERLRKIFINCLMRICQQLEADNNFGAALPYLERWVDLEPLDEKAHQQIMTAYFQIGDRTKALKHYHDLTELLAAELGVKPSSQTEMLYRELEAGEYQRSHKSLPPASLGFQPASGHLTRLIGRQTELSQLAKLYQDAKNSQGCFVLITGESGIGKTRLAQEYVAEISQTPVTRIRCKESETMIPYAPWQPVLMEAIEQSGIDPISIPTAWINSLSNIFPHLLPAHYNHENTNSQQANIPALEVINNLVTHQSLNTPIQPFQIIFDDLHWSNEPTWEALANLSVGISQLPLMIIGLCRLEDLTPEIRRIIHSLEINQKLYHLTLDRLDMEETTAMAKQVLPDENLDSIALKRLFEETEGNPFFMIEYLRSFQESGIPLKNLIIDGESGDTQTIPPTILRLIETRLDRLSPDSQELLAIAALIGRGFTFSILAVVSEKTSEEVIHCIEECQYRGLIQEDIEGYDFSHEKIREVASSSLSRAKRQYAHRQIAECLENTVQPTSAATIVHHYTRSDQPVRAIPYLAEMGAQALRIRSYHTARQFGLQAVNLLGKIPGPRSGHDRVGLNLQLVQAYAFTGNHQQAIQIIEETEHLVSRLDDDNLRSQVNHRAAQIYWLLGLPEVARDYALRAYRIAERTNQESVLHSSLRMLSRVSIALSAFDDAIAYMLQYINLEHKGHRLSSLAIIWGYLGTAYVRVGSWEQALQAGKNGVEQATQENLPDTIFFSKMQLAAVLSANQQWEASLEILNQLYTQVQDEKPSVPNEYMQFAIHGRVLGKLGKPEAGITMIQKAIAWAEETNYQVFRYLPPIFLAECNLALQSMNEDLSGLVNALADAEKAGDRWAVGFGTRILAESLMRIAAPEWQQAENYLIKSANILRQVRARPELARTYLTLRKLYDRVGQIAWAVDCHFRATTIFEELGMSKDLQSAQGQSAGKHQGSVVIPNLQLRGPNSPYKED